VLLGRASECARVEAALASAREGRSTATAVVGEAGIGKSALLEHAAASAGGMSVLSARGFESEGELAFAALTDLLRPIAGDVAALPDMQRAALEGALALGPPVGAEPLTVCVAALGLVAAAAERTPILIAIDDAHWLDRPTAEVVTFVARRLHAEPVAVLAAVRPGDGTFDSQGFDAIELEALDENDAAELALSAAPLERAVAERLADLAGGNPLAVIELAGSLTPAQRRGADPLDEPMPPGGWARHLFGRRLEALPAPARRALLIASAAGGFAGSM